MKSLWLLVCLALTISSATAGPVFNGAVTTYDTFTCVMVSSNTCTATVVNSYSGTYFCRVADTATSNFSLASCTASGTTITVSTMPTILPFSCSMVAATTCTATAPYAVTSQSKCQAGDITSTGQTYKCAISGTTITVTAATSNSDAFAIIAQFINPSTSHTFNGFITQ